MLENAFFTREVRAFSRKAWFPLSWLVAAATFAPLFALWIARGDTFESDPMLARWQRELVLATLSISQALVCAVAGWRLGSRVFGEEQRLNALDGLLLITVPPWMWVLQKLVFPVFALGVIWAAALPGWMLAAARGLSIATDLRFGLQLAGAAGLFAFGCGLMVPPERFGIPISAERRLPLSAQLQWQSLRIAAGWVVWQIAHLWSTWLPIAADSRWLQFPRHQVLGLSIGADQLLAGMLVSLLLCAVVSAFSFASPASSKARILRTSVQRLVLSLGYLTAVGTTWEGSHWMWQALLVGYPAVQLLRLAADRRTRVRSNESAFAVREVAGVQFYWDNPVLVRDLRVTLRGRGFGAIFCRQLAVLAALAVVAVVLYSGSAPGTPNMGTAVFSQFVILGAFAQLLRLGAVAAGHWGAERRMNTVPQLLLSPLTGAEIIGGRWGATLLVGAVVLLPWLVGLIAIALWGTTSPRYHLDTLSVLCWIVSLALVLSLGMAAIPQDATGRRMWWSVRTWATAWAITQPIFLTWIASSLRGATPSASVLFMALVVINWIACGVFHMAAVTEIERCRGQLSE